MTLRTAGLLAVLLAMAGWSAWWVVCNVYEFAPDLDARAFAYGWVLSLAVSAYALRAGSVRGRWLPLLTAACIGAYLLLIHRGVSAGLALALLLAASLLTCIATCRHHPR